MYLYFIENSSIIVRQVVSENTRAHKQEMYFCWLKNVFAQQKLLLANKISQTCMLRMFLVSNDKRKDDEWLETKMLSHPIEIVPQPL